MGMVYRGICPEMIEARAAKLPAASRQAISAFRCSKMFRIEVTLRETVAWKLGVIAIIALLFGRSVV